MSIESLKKQYESLIKSGQYELTKAEFNELNELHKEKFHKNIKRDCKSCGARGLRAVFGEEPIKAKQTFPKHEEPTEALTVKSEQYGELGYPPGIQYFNNLQNLIIQAIKKDKCIVKTAVHYNCFKGAYIHRLQCAGVDAVGYDKRADANKYKEFANQKGVSKTYPKEDKEFDLLIFLSGSKEELDKLIEKHNPKYVHTHLKLDKPLYIRPTLPEGTLYKIKQNK